MTAKRVLYFGYGSGGHFLRLGQGDYRSTLDPKRDVPGFPWSIEHLDTGLLKNRGVPDRPDGRVHWTCGGESLEAIWIALVWWDRSGDRRGGSNSGFYVQGFAHTEARAALDYALSAWPEVGARQAFPLVLCP